MTTAVILNIFKLEILQNVTLLFFNAPNSSSNSNNKRMSEMFGLELLQK
jgi:hypothetical protein